MKIIEGGVTAAKGFQAAAAAAEIKYKGRTDMAMVYSEVPCVAAGTFTTNVVKAAPVKWDQNIVYNHPYAQAVICNSGIANACTGTEGYGYCKETAAAAADTIITTMRMNMSTTITSTPPARTASSAFTRCRMSAVHTAQQKWSSASANSRAWRTAFSYLRPSSCA